MSELPVTAVLGIPHERGITLPGRSLTGGPTGEDPLSAEVIESLLLDMKGDIATLQAQVDKQRWEDITPAGGVQFSGEETFAIPQGEYDIIRLFMRGQMEGDADTGQVTLQINGDDTSNLHRRHLLVFNASDGSLAQTLNDAGTQWRWAQWSGTTSGNTAYATIYRTHLSSVLGFDGGGTRAYGTASPRRITVSGGSLSGSRLLSSIVVGSTAIADIQSAHIWIEGHRAD